MERKQTLVRSAAQLPQLVCAAPVFAYEKSRFSHDAVQIIMLQILSYHDFILFKSV